MAGQPLDIQEVRNEQDLMTFIRLPWEVYKGDPYWIPPLIKDQLQKFSPTNPFRRHAEMAFFLARKGGKVVGRIAAILDHHYIEYHQEKIGFFGFFESFDDREIAEALLSRVRDWLKGKGLEKIAGPMNPSTNDECALLIDGFDGPPCLMMPYNPRYYPSLLEGLGLKKAMDLYAYWVDKSSFEPNRLTRLTERLEKRDPQLRIRPIDMHHFDRELIIVKDLYNDAWSKNWGFVPMTAEEMDQTAKDLKPLVVPDIVLFAYWGDEPIAFSVAIPDYNQVLKHLDGKLGLLGMLKFLYYSRKINTVRVLLLGVRQAFQKKGVESFLYLETFRRAIKKGYLQAECSWVLEKNPLMQHGIEAFGGKRYRTYRIYEAPL